MTSDLFWTSALKRKTALPTGALKSMTMKFLAASNVSFAYNCDGSARVTGAEDPLTSLEYAADVAAAPTSGRHFTYDGTNIVAGNTAAVTSAYVPKHGALVDICAEAQTRGIKPLKINGMDVLVHVVHPKTFARYKKDADFRDALINAGDRGIKTRSLPARLDLR